MLEEATIGNSSPAEMVPLGVTRAEGTITDDDAAPTGLTISSVSHDQVDEDAGCDRHHGNCRPGRDDSIHGRHAGDR